MKRVNQSPCRTSQADALLSSTKRRKDVTSSDSETSSQMMEPGAHAAAITRPDSENSYVGPLTETETNGPLFESGSRHDDSEKDADPTSSFQRAVTDLESQITKQRKELLELRIKKRDLDKAEMNRLRSEIKRQCVEIDQLTTRTNSAVSQRDKLQEENNGLQAQLKEEGNKNNQLSEDRERLRTDMERLQKEHDQKVQSLKGQMTDMVAEKGSLLYEKKALESQIAQERNNLDKLGTSLAEQKKRVVELTTECHKHLTLICERDEQLSNLKADWETLQNECERLKQEKNKFLDEIDQLNAMLGTMREEQETEKTNNARELAKRDDLNNQLDAELSGLRIEYAEHLEDCKSKLKRLNTQLDTFRNTLECKRQATRLIDAGFALHRKNDPSAYELFDQAAVLDVNAMLPRYRKATAANIKRAGVSQASDQREVSPEQLSHLDEAVQLYGRSLANYSHTDVEGKHRRFKELHQRLYTNAELSQDALKRGNKFFNLGDYDKAAKEYEEAIKRNPGNARLYRTRAGCHLKRKPKNCADAINDCKTALKLDPNYV